MKGYKNHNYIVIGPRKDNEDPYDDYFTDMIKKEYEFLKKNKLKNKHTILLSKTLGESPSGGSLEDLCMKHVYLSDKIIKHLQYGDMLRASAFTSKNDIGKAMIYLMDYAEIKLFVYRRIINSDGFNVEFLCSNEDDYSFLIKIRSPSFYNV